MRYHLFIRYEGVPLPSEKVCVKKEPAALEAQVKTASGDEVKM